MGAFEWMRIRTQGSLDDEFRQRVERILLESFLICAEEQLRLVAFIARSAPTRESRDHFEAMAQTQRLIAQELRSAISGARPARSPGGIVGLRSVQEEAASGDLRGQLEAAIRASQASGVPLRTIILSHTGLRHLRDQGCFQAGETTISGIPVSIDLGWDEPAFVLQTFEVVPLDEILATGDGKGSPSRERHAAPPAERA